MLTSVCNNTKIYIICGYPLVKEYVLIIFVDPDACYIQSTLRFVSTPGLLIIQFRPNILHINGKKSIFNISSQQLSNLFTSSHKNEGKSSSKNNFNTL